MIQNLIKKAFGTENVNEAASFLASACNRMKHLSKAEILREAELALTGVNLQRLPGHDPALAARLRAAEAEIRSLRAELATSRQPAPAQTENQRLNTRISTLQKSLDGEREHHYRELALLRETMQRKIDGLQVTMQKDSASQRDLRNELIKNGNALVETVVRLEQQISSLKSQLHHSDGAGVDARFAYDEALIAHQNYIGVLKNDLSESRRRAEELSRQLLAQRQINLTLQHALDEQTKTTQNQGVKKLSEPGEDRPPTGGSKSFMRWIAEK